MKSLTVGNLLSIFILNSSKKIEILYPNTKLFSVLRKYGCSSSEIQNEKKAIPSGYMKHN